MNQEWIERPEGGGRTPIRMIVGLAQIVGRPVARAILVPITLYFFLRRGPERRASRAFLRRASANASWWSVARHIHQFSTVTLDRVFLLAENFRRFDVQCHGLDQLSRAVELGRGVLLYGSHVGSFDVLRALSLQRSDLEFRAVIDTGQNPALSEFLNELNPTLRATIINSRRGGISTALDIHEALRRRAVVSMLVDRARPGNEVTKLDFLGSPAPFPTAPWLLAATLKVPVLLCFGLYRGGNRYEIYFEHFADALDIRRSDRSAQLRVTIGRYIERLEHYVRMAPHNWFNFYDFWKN